VTLSDDQLRDALATGSRFWEALAQDDDDALRLLLTADVIAILAQGEIKPRPIDIRPRTMEDAFRSPGGGIATRIRTHLGAEFDRDGLPGLSTNAELLERDQLRLTYPVVGIARPIRAGVEILVWRIELILDEGRWLVDPIRRHDLPTLAVINLERLG
jgi:hypothetical protein